MQVAEGIYRLGTPYVNFYVIEEGSRLTFVDGGLSGYWDQIPTFLDSIGRSLSDIAAIVQTHDHSDHIGCTERLRQASGATVWLHENEAPELLGERKPRAPKGIRNVIFSGAALKMTGHIMKNGGAKFSTVDKLETYSDDDVLDVPGKLRVVFTPGHSPGHSSLLLEQRGVLFSGDAIVTRGLRGKVGPQLMEINADRDQAFATLDRFKDIQAEILLPGHGEPWRGSPPDAAAQARDASAR